MDPRSLVNFSWDAILSRGYVVAQLSDGSANLLQGGGESTSQALFSATEVSGGENTVFGGAA